jgi:hypothetical protein
LLMVDWWCVGSRRRPLVPVLVVPAHQHTTNVDWWNRDVRRAPPAHHQRRTGEESGALYLSVVLDSVDGNPEPHKSGIAMSVWMDGFMDGSVSCCK